MALSSCTSATAITEGSLFIRDNTETHRQQSNDVTILSSILCAGLSISRCSGDFCPVYYFRSLGNVKGLPCTFAGLYDDC